MSRAGLLVALAIAVVVGALFAIFPKWDLAIARAFFHGGDSFKLGAHPMLGKLRDVSMVLVGCLAAPAGVAVLLKILFPRSRMLVSGRAAVFLLSTLALGPWLIANVALKDQWGRPRPVNSVEFGGSQPFVPWWDPRGGCANNCSFIAGEPAAAAWTMAPAALAPAPWRALAYATAIVFTASVGFLRMAFGGHYFSDVVFAGVITFVIIWVVHGWIYRWRRTRISDAAVEASLAWLGMMLRWPWSAALASWRAAASRRETGLNRR